MSILIRSLSPPRSPPLNFYSGNSVAIGQHIHADAELPRNLNTDPAIAQNIDETWTREEKTSSEPVRLFLLVLIMGTEQQLSLLRHIDPAWIMPKQDVRQLVHEIARLSRCGMRGIDDNKVYVRKP